MATEPAPPPLRAAQRPRLPPPRPSCATPMPRSACPDHAHPHAIRIPRPCPAPPSGRASTWAQADFARFKTRDVHPPSSSLSSTSPSARSLAVAPAP